MIPVLCGHCGQRVTGQRLGTGCFRVPQHYRPGETSGLCTGRRATYGHLPDQIAPTDVPARTSPVEQTVRPQSPGGRTVTLADPEMSHAPPPAV